MQTNSSGSYFSTYPRTYLPTYDLTPVGGFILNYFLYKKFDDFLIKIEPN
jgi:hypothetical protein